MVEAHALGRAEQRVPPREELEAQRLQTITACEEDKRNEDQEQPALLDLSSAHLSRVPEKVKVDRAAVPSICEAGSVSFNAADSTDAMPDVDFTESTGLSIMGSTSPQCTVLRKNAEEGARKSCSDARQTF